MAEEFKVDLGIGLNEEDFQKVKNDINGLGKDPVVLDINTKQAESKIDALRKKMAELGGEAAKAASGKGSKGSSGSAGKGASGAKKAADEYRKTYQYLMNLQKRINSMRVRVAGLDADKNSREIMELRSQISGLTSDYNALYRAFNRKLPADKMGKLQEEAQAAAGKVAVAEAKLDDTLANRAADADAKKAAADAKQTADEYRRVYQYLMDLQKKINSMRVRAAGLDAGKNSEEIAELRSQINSLVSDYNALYRAFSRKLPADQIGKLQEEAQAAAGRAAAAEAKVRDAVANRGAAIGADMDSGKMAAELSALESGFAKLSDKGEGLSKSIGRVREALADMDAARASGDMEKLVDAYNRYDAVLKDARNQMSIAARSESGAAELSKLNNDRRNLSLQMDVWLKRNSAAAGDFGAKIRALQKELEGCDAQRLGGIRSEFRQLTKEAELAGKNTRTFGDAISAQWQKMKGYISLTTVLAEATRALRSMFDNVKSIDTAMTELKKVTDETDETYARFLGSAEERSRAIGTTMQEYVSSTSDFARLGYDINASQTLAEVANIYNVVGDDIGSIEDATQSIVSTLTAYGGELGGAENAMAIADKFNEVSNNFAISSGGIGEAMQRSASSMQAANNTLDESIALITAANTVVQNPDVVGTAFKTITMRIRGAKTELEEAGLDTEGMVTSVAELRGELQELSGVDIMRDDNTFKSTYQILDELASKWSDLEDIQQATITELIAGKRQGNIMSSLMENFDIARRALGVSEGSEGSAERELGKWQESVEAHLKKMQESWEGLSVSFLNSDSLNVLIDGAAGFISLLDAIIEKAGTLPALIGAAAGALSFKNVGIFKAVEDEAAASGLRIQGIFGRIFGGAGESFSFGDGFAEQLGSDIAALERYKEAVAGGASESMAFSTHLLSASAEAQQYARNADAAGISMDAFAKRQKFAEVGAIAAGKSYKGAALLIKEYNNGAAGAGMTQDEFVSAVGQANAGLGAYLKGLDGATASMGGYAASLIRTKAATVAVKAATAALNMGISMIASFLISKAVSAFTSYIQRQKEAREAAIEGGKAAAEQADGLEEAYIGYMKYASLGERTSAQESGFKSAVDAVTSALGEKAAELDKATAGTDAYTEAVKRATDADIDAAATEARKAAHAASEALEGQVDNWTRRGGTIVSFTPGSEQGAEDIFKAAMGDKWGLYGEWNPQGAAFSVTPFNFTDPSDIEAVVDYYYRLLDAQGEMADQGMMDTKLYKEISETIEGLRGNVEAYVSAKYDELKLDYEQRHGIPTTIEEYRNMRAAIMAASGTAGEYRQVLLDMMDQDFSGLFDMSEVNGGAEDAAKTAKSLQDILDSNIGEGTDTTFSDYISNYTDSVAALQEALEKNKAGLLEQSDKISLALQFPDLAPYINDADALGEAIGNLINGTNADVNTKIDTIINNLSDDAPEAAEALESLRLALNGLLDAGAFKLDDEIARFDSLLAAVKESSSATGLSAESIGAVTGMFADMEGYDPSVLFERTEHGIHLNTSALRALQSQYEATRKSELGDELSELKRRYDDAKASLEGMAEGTEEYNEKAAEIGGIESQIRNVQTLAAQYEGLASSYNKWVQAQSSGEEGDMYDNIAGSLKDLREQYKNGLIGTNQFRAAVQMMTDEDLSTAGAGKLISVYEKGYPAMKRYFTENRNGCLQFLKDVEAIDSSWAHMNKDGSWDINFGVGNDEEIAEAVSKMDGLHMSAEEVQIIMRKLSDYGFDIKLDSAYTSIEELQTRIDETEGKLEKLGKKPVGINVDVADGDVQAELEKARKLIRDIRKSDMSPEVKTAKLDDAYAKVERLVRRLNQPAFMELDASQVDADVQEALGLLQKYQTAVNNVKVAKISGADKSETEAAEKSVDRLARKIKKLPAEVKTKIGLDVDAGIKDIKEAVRSGKIQVPVAVTADTSQADTAIEGEDGKEVKVGVETSGNDALDALKSALDDIQSKDITVTANTFGMSPVNQLREALDHITSLNGRTVSIGFSSPAAKPGGKGKNLGTRGTAFAKGSWGAKGAGTALVGELGAEMVVRDDRYFVIGGDSAEFFRYREGDIVFDADQTEEILGTGRISRADRRGHALAGGTAPSGAAFSSGFGRFTAGGRTVTTPAPPAKKKNKKKKKNDKKEKDFEETFDWIETAIDRVERAVDRLDARAGSAYSGWSARNKALKGEISKIGDEIGIQKKGYDRYVKEANSIKFTKKQAGYRDKVMKGEISIEDVKNEKLANKIKEYQQWYEKAIGCRDAVRELKEREKELYKERFDNVASRYEDRLSAVQHEGKMLEESVSQSEAKGYVASAEYYDALISNKRKEKKKLEKERAALQIALDDAVSKGKIKEGSEAWYEMVGQIDGVTEAIKEADGEIIGFKNDIRDAQWELFDMAEDGMSRLADESDFLIGLFDSDKLFDGKGKLTDEGASVMGLHGLNYNTYMAQADDYAAEAERIERELASDPYNTDLLNRRQELLQLQRESISAAKDEKAAIIDMVEEGIEKELDSLKELIDAYSDSLDAAKDLYDYQNGVREQADEIASLEKQLAAYGNDDSEESRAKRQELGAQLEEARRGLEETEYDRYVSDQKELLDGLYSEYEEALNSRMDNVDALLSEMIAGINSNASTISSTLTQASAAVGYEMSGEMQGIWGSASAALSEYNGGFVSYSTAAQEAFGSIKEDVGTLRAYADQAAAGDAAAAAGSSAAGTDGGEGGSSGGKIEDILASGKKHPKKLSKKEKEGHHKLWRYIVKNYGHAPTNSTYKKLAEALGVDVKGDEVTKEEKDEILKKLKAEGYASGARNIGSGGAYWTQEGGRELIVRPSDGAVLTPIARNDSILDAEASGNIWKMANDPEGFVRGMLHPAPSPVPAVPAARGSYTQNFDKVVFSMPNVKNYDELIRAMQHDRNFERLVASMTVDRMAGGSSLSKYRAVR